MKKILIAALAGGLALFIWSALSWTTLPLHKSSIHTIPNEDFVATVLKTGIPSKGVYLFPASPGMTGDLPADQAKAPAETFMKKMQTGPNFWLIYDPSGYDPAMAGQYIWGFILDLIAAILAAWLLSRSTARGASYVSRVVFCGTLGIFASFVSFLPAWNWMGYPMDYTTAMVADAVIGWLIAGLVIAAIVKAPAAQPA